MKTIGKLILAIAVLLPLMIGGLSVRAASDADIDAAIEDGLAWLASQQAPDGSWGQPGWSAEAATGLAVLKFEDRAIELGLDPFDPDYEYSAQVEAGLNYLFSGTQEAGGLVWVRGSSWTDNCNTGIGMMALGASRSPDRIVPPLGSPVDGWTYEQVLQGMLDWMEDAQNDGTPGCECDEGGWTYVANGACSSDQSNTGYSTLGIGYAIAPVYGFGLTVDPNVLAKLDIFIDNVQSADGGSDYNPCSLWNQSNMLRTGNLLYEMALVGRPLEDPTVQAAIGFIENNWPGWMGDSQATFTMMKGLVAYQIETLTVGGTEIDWFDEVSTNIVSTQNPDGSWPESWGRHLDEAWNLLTLEKVVAPVNQPPDCSAAAPSISEIWPPNHKMVGVDVLGVTDPEGAPVSVVITGITQDEPVNGLGDGDASPDGAGVGTDKAQVRAERAGKPKVPGNGRVYHIHFEASDGMAVCSGVAKVGVPHDQRPGHVIVDGGELYDSTLP